MQAYFDQLLFKTFNIMVKGKFEFFNGENRMRFFALPPCSSVRVLVTGDSHCACCLKCFIVHSTIMGERSTKRECRLNDVFHGTA